MINDVFYIIKSITNALLLDHKISVDFAIQAPVNRFVAGSSPARGANQEGPDCSPVRPFFKPKTTNGGHFSPYIL
jgi:hypothetical protein